eukprot:PITA_01836
MGLYGYQTPSIASYFRENSKVQAVEHHIEHQQQVLQLLKDNLVLAQNRMKQQQANKDNKLSQSIMVIQGVEKISTMDTNWSFPAASRLHPVFHVSCLKKVIGDKLPVQTILPELDEEGKIILEPEAVTETRTRHRRNRSISEYLIKCKQLSAEDSTWEDDNFIQKYPELLKH